MENGICYKLLWKKCQRKVHPNKNLQPKRWPPMGPSQYQKPHEKTRKKLYASFKIYKSNKIITSKFKQLKHQIQRQIRESYNSYLESILTDQPKNVQETHSPNKRFWTFIKQQKSDSNEITSLKSNDTTYTRPTDKANILNNQFCITKTCLFKYTEHFNLQKMKIFKKIWIFLILLVKT